MRYEIRSQQDYSNRFAGSWGSVILDHPDRVDEFFLRDSDRKVIVLDDNDLWLTGELDADQWNAWKKQNRPLPG